MGAPRVKPDEIVTIQKLYAQLGTYASVARIVGRSPQTVARYIKLNGTPKIVAHTFREVVREI